MQVAARLAMGCSFGNWPADAEPERQPCIAHLGSVPRMTGPTGTAVREADVGRDMRGRKGLYFALSSGYRL
jgi:hypothetical protein